MRTGHKKMLCEYDWILDDTEDKLHMIRQMVAEFGLCCRKGVSEETLIKEYEGRKLEWHKNNVKMVVEE